MIIPTTGLRTLGISLLFFLLVANVVFATTDTIPNANPPCHLGLVIPDSSCASANRFRIAVTGINGTQMGTDVYLSEVRIIVAHTWLADLDITLISPPPHNVRVVLTQDNGGDKDNFGNPNSPDCGPGSYLSFTNSACNSIASISSPPFVGNYRPIGNLFDFNNGSNPNGFWFLEVCDDAGNDEGTLEFVELVFAPVTCLAPTEVRVLEVDSTAVTLDWKKGSSCQTTILEYAPHTANGFTPGTDSIAREGTVRIVGCPPFTLTGLLPDTEYDIYIREYCGNGSFSSNSCPIQFQTGCLPPPRTLVETFNSQTKSSGICGEEVIIHGVWHNSVLDNFDWLVNSGSTTSLNTGPDDDADKSGGKYIYIETSGALCRTGNEAFLTSNCIEVDASGADSCHFSFQYHMYGKDVNKLSLQITTNGGSSWQTIWEKQGNLGNRWFKQYINLSPWHGQIVQFRFVGTGGSGSNGDIALDNLIFYGSRDMGFPSYTYYVDADGDGYGNPLKTVNSCSPDVPFGYVANNNDCNDSQPAINPDATEIVCNNVDENCNGAADDKALPPPITSDTSLCNGQQAVLLARSPLDLPGSFIIWYDNPTGVEGAAFDTGTGLPITLTNDSDTAITKTVYAEIFTFSECVSTVRAPATVTVNPKPSLVTATPPDICQGQTFDLERLTIVDEHNTNGVLTFYTALPADSSTMLDTLLISPTQSTSYFVKSVNSFGCSDVEEFPVTVKTGTAVSITPQDTSAVCLRSNTLLRAEVTDDENDVAFQWNTGATSSSITIRGGDAIGAVSQYIVSAMTADGCISSDTAWVQTTGGRAARSVNDVTTCGGNDGSIIVEPLVGTPPFRYTWSGPVSGEAEGENGAYTISNLKQGTYIIIIEDSSPERCPLRLPFTVVNGPNAQVQTDFITNVSCKGANDGVICLAIDANNPTIQWSNGESNYCIDSLAGGTYSVTVTEGNCETVLSNIEVEEPDTLELGILKTEPLCTESATGHIDITVLGGTGSFSFMWEDSTTTTEDRHNISAGRYQLTVTDEQGCRLVSDTITLGAPEPMSIGYDSLEHPSCYNLADGKIIPVVTGGTAPYFYQWSNNSASKNQRNLEAGTYTLTVTDANGCTMTQDFTIQNPPALAIQLDSIRDASCRGVPDGAIFISATGGVGGYSYRWNINRQTQNLRNVNYGIYSVVVGDANGCQDTATFEVHAPEDLTVAIAVTEPTCLGRKNGKITLTPTTVPAQQFIWNTGATSKDLTNIGVGHYAVTITAANGCVFDTAVTVTAPENFIIEYLSINSPACFGGNDGSITLNILAVNPSPRTYRWNTGQRTEDIKDLTSGHYVLTVSDANGCQQVTDTITLTTPPKIEISSETLTAVSCYGDASGVIDITVSGGYLIDTYTYTWSNGAHTEDLYDLPAGNYRLTVVDAENCSVESEVFRIEQPDSLHVDYQIFKVNDCETSRTTIDSLVLVVRGGTPPYSYRWNNGRTTKSLANLPSGTYSVTVKDANGCTFSIPSITVKPPGSGLTMKVASTDVSCYGAADGRLDVTVSGGIQPFTYHFSNSDSYENAGHTAAVENLTPGTYSVTVIDASGCIDRSAEYIVRQPSRIAIAVNGSDIHNVTCAGENDGEIVNMQISGGVEPYSYRWYNVLTGNTVANTRDLHHVPEGMYQLIVTDANLCQDSSRQYTIRGNSQPLVITTSVKDVTCFGDNNGSIRLDVSGGAAPYEYLWNYQNRTTRDLLSIPAGYYSVTIQDDNGCSRILDSLHVKQADLPIVITDTLVTPATCSNVADGGIQVNITGGVTPYQNISWTSSDYPGFFINDFTDLTNLLPGNYTLSVKDKSGCNPLFNFEVPSPPAINITLSSTPSRPNEATGSVSAEVTGGASPYSYAWSIPNSPDSSRVDSLPEGIYRLTVTDANSCTAERPVIVERDTVTAVNELSPLQATILLQPNPTSGDALLDVELEEPMDLQIEIYSLLGQRLWQHTEGRLKKMAFTLPTAEFAAGTYLIRIAAEGKQAPMRKLVVVRR